MCASLCAAYEATKKTPAMNICNHIASIWHTQIVLLCTTTTSGGGDEKHAHNLCSRVRARKPKLLRA